MQRAGYDVIQAGSAFGADGDGTYAYFDTIAVLGLSIEAVEPPKRPPPPDSLWPEPQGV